MQQEIIEPAPAPAITTKIAEYSTTAAALGELRGKYEKVLFEVTTTKGMADAVAARAELRNLRTGLEKKRKEIKAPALQRCQDIDAEAKTITAALTALEDPIDAQIQAETARKAAEKAERERVEAARVAAIRTKIEAIRGIPLGMAGAASAELMTEKLALEQFDTSADFAELTDEANSAVLSAIRALNDLYHAAKAREDEIERQAALAEANRVAAAEIERQRQELAAQQAENARVAAEQQAERDRIAAVALAEQQRVAAENKRQMEAQQAEINAQRAAMEQQQRDFEAKLAAQAAEDERRKQALADAEENEKRVAAMTTETVVAALDGADDDTHLSLLAEVIGDVPVASPYEGVDLASQPNAVTTNNTSCFGVDLNGQETIGAQDTIKLDSIISDMMASGWTANEVRAAVEDSLARHGQEAA